MSASLGEQVKGFEEAARPRLRPWLQLDPLLLIATLGLIGFGSYVIGTATTTSRGRSRTARSGSC